MRRRSESVIFRNEPVVERIRQIKSDHPFWGYRRTRPKKTITNAAVLS